MYFRPQGGRTKLTSCATSIVHSGLSSDHSCKAFYNGCTEYSSSYQDYEVQSSVFNGEVRGEQITAMCCMYVEYRPE